MCQESVGAYEPLGVPGRIDETVRRHRCPGGIGRCVSRARLPNHEPEAGRDRIAYRFPGPPGSEDRIINENTALKTEASPPGDPSVDPGDPGLGWRATRTRGLILDAARGLFLDRGYAGTRVRNITDASGISRAGFYTYFKDKREVFEVLGTSAYRDVLAVVGRWDAIPRPCAQDDVAAWVREWFTLMERHGAFIFASGHSAPEDDDFRAGAQRLQMRVAWML